MNHISPPKGDFFGPGTRIPAGIAGITMRDNTLQANGFAAMGDLTNALVLP